MGCSSEEEKKETIIDNPETELFHFQGYLKLKPLLSQETCQNLRNYILEDFEKANTLQQDEKSMTSRFSLIHQRKNRWDLKLNPDPIVKAALREVQTQFQLHHQRRLLEDILAPICLCRPEDVVLAELACLISRPGAPAQDWHADSAHTGAVHPDCICCFITLQDTPISIGPVQFIPRTQEKEFHDDALCNFPPRGIMPAYAAPNNVQVGYELAGEACLMDCRLYHRGGANFYSEDAVTTDAEKGCDGQRLVFYFTVRSRTREPPGGFLFTIMEEMNGKQLVDFL